ncbi:hypothetical protein HPB50_005989 [Hyalomma asiaticum]|uniref:Uncharacterized protein n=1 Tax=Hyalomma asiaticum TaxID=266040 RepID=A0ACB7S841_HYAAI|nr:hypothetical protein HPB50_005989 [Hyalomma asiaticum]
MSSGPGRSRRGTLPESAIHVDGSRTPSFQPSAAATRVVTATCSARSGCPVRRSCLMRRRGRDNTLHASPDIPEQQESRTRACDSGVIAFLVSLDKW